MPPAARTFSDQRGTGTFHSLGDLPKRKHASVCHIPHDVDDNENSNDPPRPVPFPCTTSPDAPSPASPPTPPRPQLSRGISAPILLSTGKPLKSSLRTPPSTPSISIPPGGQRLHLRARSEPGTPSKKVHFPEKDYGLATVRLFCRTARPAALSNLVNGDETETEGEDTPLATLSSPPTFPITNYEIDPTKTSPIPSKDVSPPHVILESLHLPPCSPSTSSLATKLSLTGSILVSNLAFEKNVAVRFTLDDWQTVSEVGAHYVESLSLLPSHIQSSPSASTCCRPGENGWDRFTFTIRLDDYAPSLSTRTLWLASRYRTDSTYPEPGSAEYGPGGEWWDNNHGCNYCIAFRPAMTAPAFSRGKPRRETISEPISSRPRPPPSMAPPMTSKEHAPGFTLPAIHQPPVMEGDKPTIPLRTGKLCLFNYAPPTVPATSSVQFPSVRSPRHVSSTSMTNSDLSTSSANASQPPSCHASDDDSGVSPASSALSTPTVSPTIAPRVLINGHPATAVEPHRLHEEDGLCEYAGVRLDPGSMPGHVKDWDWSASSDKLRHDLKQLSRQRTDPGVVPGLDPRPRREAPTQGRKASSGANSDNGMTTGSSNSKSLYDAFVTQWCFAQGPSPRGYSDGGIMA